MPTLESIRKDVVKPEPAPIVFESIDKEQPVPVDHVQISGWNPRKMFSMEVVQ